MNVFHQFHHLSKEKIRKKINLQCKSNIKFKLKILTKLSIMHLNCNFLNLKNRFINNFYYRNFKKEFSYSDK